MIPRMFSDTYKRKFRTIAHFCAYFLSCALLLGLGPVWTLSAAAQQKDQQSDQQPTTQNPNQQEAPPEAGGPNADTGPYSIPKKTTEEPPPPPPERPKKVEGMPDYSIHVDVPLVTVPVMVTTKDGQFIPNLKKDNFRVYEDGKAQTIDNFKIE